MSFFTKRSASANDQFTRNKRQRTQPSKPSAPLRPYPRTIAFWNCNGLSARLRYDTDVTSIKYFLKERAPDILFLSEVRLPAAHNAGQRKPTSQTTFYRNRIRQNDKASSADYALANMLLNSDECAHYKPYFSLANTKYAGTAMLLNTNTTAMPVSVRFNLEKVKPANRNLHDTSGRVIVAKFPHFSILHTYSPNHGTTEESFERRRKWDDAMNAFMLRKKEAGVRMMWIGDLNIAPKDEDLSHPAYFRRPTKTSSGEKPRDPEDEGEAGCTDGERRRFAEICANGSLCDAFRLLYDDRKSFTWRSIRGGPSSDKAMRIDLCILSNQLVKDVEGMEVLGQEEGRVGFMGSDHCPVLVICKANMADTRQMGTSGEGCVMSGGDKVAESAVNGVSKGTSDGVETKGVSNLSMEIRSEGAKVEQMGNIDRERTECMKEKCCPLQGEGCGDEAA